MARFLMCKDVVTPDVSLRKTTSLQGLRHSHGSASERDGFPKER